MKKEMVLMLIAGSLFGGVAGFIGTQQYYLKKMASAPLAPVAQAKAQGTPGGAQPEFNPEQHSSMMQQAIKKAKDSKDPKDKTLLGNIYYDRGNFKEAARWYEDAIRLDDKDPNILVDLGICYKNTNRPQDAIVQFDKALALEKDKKEALFNKVVVYAFDLEDKSKAEAALKRLKEVAGGDPKVAELEAKVKNGA